MGHRILVLHNPTAGWLRRHRFAAALTALTEAGHKVDLRHTERAGHAEEMARDGVDGAYDMIAVAGGDGTVREVANGLVGHDTPLAVIPLGTANVLAHEIGIGASIDRAVACISAGRAISIRPGLCDGRVFMLMASAGLDSRVVAAITRPAKRVLGKGAYVTGAIRAMTRRAQPVILDADGQKMEAAIAIATRARCYGGPMVIAPEAGLAEPALWLVALAPGGAARIAGAGLALLTGRAAQHPAVTIRRVETVRFLGPDGHPLQQDGDDATRLPATATVDARTLRLIVPQLASS